MGSSSVLTLVLMLKLVPSQVPVLTLVQSLASADQTCGANY